MKRLVVGERVVVLRQRFFGPQTVREVWSSPVGWMVKLDDGLWYRPDQIAEVPHG